MRLETSIFIHIFMINIGIGVVVFQKFRTLFFKGLGLGLIKPPKKGKVIPLRLRLYYRL